MTGLLQPPRGRLGLGKTLRVAAEGRVQRERLRGHRKSLWKERAFRHDAGAGKWDKHTQWGETGILHMP